MRPRSEYLFIIVTILEPRAGGAGTRGTMLVDAQGAQHLQAETAGGGLALKLREIGGAEEGRERAETRAI